VLEEGLVDRALYTQTFDQVMDGKLPAHYRFPCEEEEEAKSYSSPARSASKSRDRSHSTSPPSTPALPFFSSSSSSSLSSLSPSVVLPGPDSSQLPRILVVAEVKGEKLRFTLAHNASFGTARTRAVTVCCCDILLDF